MFLRAKYVNIYCKKDPSVLWTRNIKHEDETMAIVWSVMDWKCLWFSYVDVKRKILTSIVYQNIRKASPSIGWTHEARPNIINLYYLVQFHKVPTFGVMIHSRWVRQQLTFNHFFFRIKKGKKRFFLDVMNTFVFIWRIN